MDSSEIVDSGGRSNFSQTCNLLSQYLKEKRSFGDLNLGSTHNKGILPIGTLNLLPMIEKSSQNHNIQFNEKKEAETAQMTVFYAGQVIVFNDLSPEKAKEVMDLASKSARNHHSAAFAPTVTAQSPAELPIQRKNSLARFLKKRKERVSANAPYQTSKPVASQPKPAKAETWLGLGPHQFSHQMQPQ